MTGDEAAPGALTAIGLEPAEEVAYELLIEHPSSTVDQLARRWHQREPLAEILASLEHKGFATAVGGQPARYAAVPPDVAVEAALRAAEQQLRQARDHLPRLTAEYRHHAAGQRSVVVDVVRGPEAVRRWLTQLHRAARYEVRCLAKPSFLGGGHALLATPPSEPVSHRVIVERGDAGDPAADVSAQVRITAQLPVPLVFVDDRIAMVPLRDPVDGAPAAALVYPSRLLDALRLLFDYLWERTAPVSTVAPATAVPLSADQLQLVELLLSGATHGAVARQLGISQRTVERRVAALMTDVGARTTFQSGVQAALRITAQNDPRLT